MTNRNFTKPGRWQFSGNTPLEIMQLLPRMDRLMVIVNTGNIVHERIGIVGDISVTDDIVSITGDTHDAQVQLSSLSKVYFDTTSQMKDKTLPRLDFRDENDETVFAAVGLEGIEPFVNAVQNHELSSVDPLDRPPRGEFSDEEIDAEDPGNKFLQDLAEDGTKISVQLEKSGITQRWTGQIESVRPIMGHINIIQTDFHLHLPAGLVSGWSQNNTVWDAIDEHESSIGLTVEILS